jgi:hypothetical protein
VGRVKSIDIKKEAAT